MRLLLYINILIEVDEVNGTAHASIGATTGFIVANTFQATPSATLLLVGLGCVSGLVPDLDIDGTLRGKITFNHKVLRTVAQLIGMMVILYSFFEGGSRERWIGVGIGLAIIVIASYLKQRHMLTLTGIGVIIGGASQSEMWLFLLGIYIIIASFVSHRSYTHSILGVVFFGIIGFNLEVSLGIEGTFYACLAGYISHLIADFKFLPFNKRGIKLFLPLSSKEI